MSVVLKNFNNEKQIYIFQCHFHNSLSTVCIGGWNYCRSGRWVGDVTDVGEGGGVKAETTVGGRIPMEVRTTTGIWNHCRSKGWN